MARTATRPIPAGRDLAARGADRSGSCSPRSRSLRALADRQPARRGALLRRASSATCSSTRSGSSARTPQNIVIGGAAGAVPPLVGWAAVTGSVSGTAVILFAIVFFWTPPHFWALSLLMKDEYARVGVPMMPVVRGEAETRRQILLYTVLLVRRHAAARSARAASARSTSSARSRSGSASSRAPCACTAVPTAAQRCACTSSRWPISRSCSARWSPTRICRSDR